MKNILEIWLNEEGNIQTKFLPFEEVDTIKVGVMLASATRVISAAFCDAMNLDESHLKPIQDQIAKFYKDDLRMGTMGEEENTKLDS